MLIVIENLHFVDEPSVRVLEEWAQSSFPLPILGISTSRPGPRATKFARRDSVNVIDLHELDAAAAREMILRRFEDPREASDLADAILARTGGHPLFIEEILASLLHRQTIADFVPVAREIARLVNEHTGLEVAEVVPVSRIPKTTSGKVQRHLLEAAYLAGEFDPALTELRALLQASSAATRPAASQIEAQLQAICATAFAGRVLGVDDDLFDLGASSLKLIEIHEQIDQAFPGTVDLTELFDHPTLAQLATFIESRLAAAPHTDATLG